MNEDKSIDWKAMIEKLSSYSGTIKDIFVFLYVKSLTLTLEPY